MNLQYLIVHKPYGFLSQFSKDHPDQKTLADLLNVDKEIYPVGRLDKDSEGLLLLSNDRQKAQYLILPKTHISKSYFVQLDGQIDHSSILKLSKGIDIRIKKKIYKTMPCEVKVLKQAPRLPERDPPIRVRKNIPTSWINITIEEGKNRQIRRMCAEVSFPVLRIFRHSIGTLKLGTLGQGKYRSLTTQEIQALFAN